MPKKTILLLTSCLFFYAQALAQEKTNFEDRLISLTLKTLARTFVAVEDVDNLMRVNIIELTDMQDGRFKKRFAKVYEVLKDLPPEIRIKYHIWKDMSKEAVIRELESLNKKKMYALIDDLPDAAVAGEFRNYIARHSWELKGRNILEQINIFWSRVVRRKQNVLLSPRAL